MTDLIDILSRLDWPLKTVLANGHAYINADDPIMREAAAEIRRLLVEIDRLRAALQEIASYPSVDVDAWRLNDIARRALDLSVEALAKTEAK